MAVCRAARPSRNTEQTNSSSAKTGLDKKQNLLPSPEASSVQQPASSHPLEVSAVCPICLETKLDLGQTGTPTYRYVHASVHRKCSHKALREQLNRIGLHC